MEILGWMVCKKGKERIVRCVCVNELWLDDVSGEWLSCDGTRIERDSVGCVYCIVREGGDEILGIGESMGIGMGELMKG